MSTESAQQVTKAESWKFEVIKFLSPLVAATFPLFFSSRGETVYYWLSVAVILSAGIGTIVFWWFGDVPRPESALKGLDGAPLPAVANRRYWKISLTCLTLAVVQFGVVWWSLRDQLFPLASIHSFQGSKIASTRDSDFFLVHEGVNIRLLEPAEDVWSPRAVNLTIVKASTVKKVRIVDVELHPEAVPEFALLHSFGTFPANVVVSNRFLVDLKRQAAVYKAIPLTDKGKIGDGVIFLDENTSAAKFHIDFEGGTGLYRFNVTVTVRDDDNSRVQTLRFPDAVLVFDNTGARDSDLLQTLRK